MFSQTIYMNVQANATCIQVHTCTWTVEAGERGFSAPLTQVLTSLVRLAVKFALLGLKHVL